MTFPTIPTAALSQTGSTNATSFNVNMPSGIASGDLLIAQVARRFADVMTWPAGWTALTAGTNTTLIRQDTRYRVADGTESTAITLTTTTETRWVAICHLIRDYSGVPEGDALGTNGNSSNANPPNFAPSWGGADTLYIAYGGWDGAAGVSAGPANYPDYFHTHNATFVTRATAFLFSTAASSNPDPFTSETEQWVTATVAVKGTVLSTSSGGAAAAYYRQLRVS